MRLVKRISLLLALLDTVGTFTACSKFEYDNSTVMARVESIDGQKVVLLVGEMVFGRGMYPEEFGGGMGSLPDFGGESPNMEVPPEGEFPSGFEGMQRPEGEFPSGFEGMQRPEGELPEGFGGMQIPGGQFPSRSGDMQMPFRGNGDQIMYTIPTNITITILIILDCIKSPKYANGHRLSRPNMIEPITEIIRYFVV